MNSNSPIVFTWLRDLPKPEYEKRGEDVEKLFPPDPNFAVKNGNGEMTVPKLVTVDKDGKKLLDDVRGYEQIFTWLKYSARHNGTDVTDQEDTLQKARQFGEFLRSKQGDQTMYQILMSQMPPQSTVKFAKGVHGLNDALNLDINFDALGPKELTDVNELDYRVKVRAEWEKRPADSLGG